MLPEAAILAVETREVSMKNEMKKKAAKLDRLIEKAVRREQNDDHLSREERQEIVDLFKEVGNDPFVVLTGDLDDDFVSIIG